MVCQVFLFCAFVRAAAGPEAHWASPVRTCFQAALSWAGQSTSSFAHAGIAPYQKTIAGRSKNVNLFNQAGEGMQPESKVVGKIIRTQKNPKPTCKLREAAPCGQASLHQAASLAIHLSGFLSLLLALASHPACP